jgi:hypothetical protein
LNSIDNFFNNEIRITPKSYQTSLLFLGVHAVALTIGEVFFNHQGVGKDLRNYTNFLKTFVDGPTADTQFSIVAGDIHNWRNILAHQWIGSLGHTIEYDYNSHKGWKREAGRLIINPEIYCGVYLQAFATGGKIWQYDSVFNPQQLIHIQNRIVEKYVRR